MSNWSTVDIKELYLKIPKKAFPLKSDVIIGYENPHLLVPDDESHSNILWPKEEGEFFIFKVDKKKGLSAYENYDDWSGEISGWVEDYKGTFIADCCDEGNETTYIRIRDGKSKKVRVVEEDE